MNFPVHEPDTTHFFFASSTMKNAAPLINIFFYGLALSWVLNLQTKECECSANWRRDYLKYYFMAVILFQAMLLMHNKDLTKMLAGPIGIASLFYLYVTITYVRDLERKDCACTSGHQRTILYWMAVIQAALLAWSIFVHFK